MLCRVLAHPLAAEELLGSEPLAFLEKRCRVGLQIDLPSFAAWSAKLGATAIPGADPSLPVGRLHREGTAAANIKLRLKVALSSDDANFFNVLALGCAAEERPVIMLHLQTYPLNFKIIFFCLRRRK